MIEKITVAQLAEGLMEYAKNVNAEKKRSAWDEIEIIMHLVKTDIEYTNSLEFLEWVIRYKDDLKRIPAREG